MPDEDQSTRDNGEKSRGNCQVCFFYIEKVNILLMFSYMGGGVLVCGGRSGTEVHQDCVRYILGAYLLAKSYF